MKLTQILKKYTFPILLLTAGCGERIETKYIKDNNVEITRIQHGEKEHIQFYSGKTFVHYKSVNGVETITLREVDRKNSLKFSEVSEVENLKKLVDRYRTKCVLLNENGDVAHLPRSSASYIRSCYKKNDTNQLKSCLLLGAPKNWKVDCR